MPIRCEDMTLPDGVKTTFHFPEPIPAQSHETYIDVVLCPFCDKTHMTILYPDTGLITAIDLDPEEAETLAKHLINPRPMPVEEQDV